MNSRFNKEVQKPFEFLKKATLWTAFAQKQNQAFSDHQDLCVHQAFMLPRFFAQPSLLLLLKRHHSASLFRALISCQYSHKHHLTIKSKTGLMVAKAAALRIKIDTDRRPLSAKKRLRMSSKLCAPELLTADSLLRSNATVLGLPFQI